LFLIVITCAEFYAVSIRAQNVVRESDVKATLLFNFSQFVTWPAGAFPGTNSPFVIGILGTDPFGPFLDDLVRQERVGGRLIEIRRFRSQEEAEQAHILYVSWDESEALKGLFRRLRRKPVLTVGEGAEPGFVRRGGMISFRRERDNVRLRINLEATREAGLVVSTKLLRVADVVGNPG
jgi:hypothetical protein